MATLQELLDEVKRLREAVENLPARVRISGEQIAVVNGLSDVSEKLGLIQAGEFRAGNRIEPGDGFSGVRIAYPALSYGGNLYNVAGIDADTITVAFNSSDGSIITGDTEVTMSSDGLVFLESTLSRLRWVNGSALRSADLTKAAASAFSIRSDTELRLETGPDIGSGGSTDALFRIRASGNMILGAGDTFNIEGSSGSGIQIRSRQDVTLFGGQSGDDSGGSVQGWIYAGDSETTSFLFREDPALANRSQFDLGILASGGKYTMGSEIEIHGQGTAAGQTFISMSQSSDTPSTSDPSLDAAEVRMYYRAGNLVFQVFSTGDTDEDRYFYTRMSGTDASSDWIISTVAV